MAASRELTALVNNRRTVAALENHYVRVIEQVVRELAAGVSKPGAARARQLTARLNKLIDKLNPSRSKVVRNWIKRNIPRSFVLGDRRATIDLRKDLREQASGQQRQEFGAVNDAFTGVSQTSLKAITAAMEASLRNASENVRSIIGTTIQRTKGTLQQNKDIQAATVSGIIRGSTGKQVADDIAAALLGDKIRPAVRKRLGDIGFTGRDFENFEQVANKNIISVGGRRMSVRSYANLVAKTQLREAHKVGTIVRLQQNEIDHVKVSKHTQSVRDECTPFAGKVFYIGPLAKDPAGFRKLSSTPNGGPPFHPNCKHVVQPFVVEFVGKKAVENALEDSQSVPRRFFGKTASQTRKAVDDTPLEELREIASTGVLEETAA